MPRFYLLYTVFFMCATSNIVFAPQAHAQNIIITGVEDYPFGTYTVGTGDQILTRAVCVGKTAGNQQWDAVVNGSGAGGAYTLDDGGGNTVPFTLRLVPNPSFTAGVANTNLNGADNNAPLDCDGVDNENFEITLPGTALNGTPAGTYTGSITIVVSP